VFIVVGEGVQVKPVEGDALDTDSDLGQIRPHLGVEPIAIHAQILRCIA
jgi:hypothetical protein